MMERRQNGVDTTPPPAPQDPQPSQALPSHKVGLVPLRERIKYVSSACISCRTRKVKCDGDNPCTKCRHAQTQCVYSLEADGRRSTYRKWLGIAADKETARLDYLLQLIRTSEDDKVTEFISLVRQSMTATEIRGKLDQWISQQTPSEPIVITAFQKDGIDTKNSEAALVNYFHQLREAFQSNDIWPDLESQDSLHAEADGRQHPTRSPGPSLSNAFGNMPASSAIGGGCFPSSVQEQQLRLFQQPVWMLRPMAVNDGSPFCRAYVSFLEVAQAAICAGKANEVMGGERPRVNWFFRPPHEQSTVNVSESACLLFAAFPSIEPIERLAWLVSVVKLIKWILDPTIDSYGQLGALRPNVVQLMLPHSASYDLVVSSELRDVLCRRPGDFIAAANKCSVNWCKRLDQAVEIDCNDGSVYPTAEFETHVRDPTNWTYD